PAEEAEDVEQAMKENLRDHFVGARFEVLSFLSERIKETLTGTGAALAVKVYGDDFGAIERAAQKIVRALTGIEGSDNVHAEAQTGVPELVVRLRPRDAAPYELRNAHLLDALHTAYQGAEVGQVYLG